MQFYRKWEVKMITDQLKANSKLSQANKTYYGKEALKGPTLDTSGFKEIKHWLLYKESDTTLQLLELSNDSLLNAKKVILNFKNAKPHLYHEKSVMSGDDIFNYVNQIMSTYKLEIESHKQFITICNILN